MADKQLKAVTIAGTGRGGAGHRMHRAFGLNPRVEMAALADPDAEGRVRLAAECGATTTYADYREMLERELRRYRTKVGKQDLRIACGDLGYDDEEHMYAALGAGDLSLPRLVNRLLPDQKSPKARPATRDSRGIRIQGMDDLMISFARCCTPIPGDQIIGLVTRGRGVSVHRLNCANIADVGGQPERLVNVEWDLETECAFTVQLRIKSHDRKYLLSEITKSISDTGANIRGSATRTEGSLAVEEFWLEVRDIKQLKLAIDRILKVEGVLDVKRVDEMEAAMPLS